MPQRPRSLPILNPNAELSRWSGWLEGPLTQQRIDGIGDRAVQNCPPAHMLCWANAATTRSKPSTCACKLGCSKLLSEFLDFWCSPNRKSIYTTLCRRAGSICPDPTHSFGGKISAK